VLGHVSGMVWDLVAAKEFMFDAFVLDPAVV
jgi:hypothetical protein